MLVGAWHSLRIWGETLYAILGCHPLDHITRVPICQRECLRCRMRYGFWVGDASRGKGMSNVAEMVTWKYLRELESVVTVMQIYRVAATLHAHSNSLNPSTKIYIQDNLINKKKFCSFIRYCPFSNRIPP